MDAAFTCRQGWLRAAAAAAMLSLGAGCGNTPYPGGDEEHGIVHYRAFQIPPKDFDPQRSYTSADGLFLSMCYERLLGYDYLARPVQLVPELATEVPEAEPLTGPNGEPDGVRYRFPLRQGVHFIDDPCFPDGKGRELTAYDFEFAFKRLADPDVNCPVADAFANIRGFNDYRDRVAALREAWADRNSIAATDLYREAGDLDGIRVVGDYEFELILSEPYPQILYWLAMRFVVGFPWEAVEYYDGSLGAMVDGEPMEFGQRPVGTGAYRFKWDEFHREAKIVMVRNEHWWGLDENQVAPGTRYPLQPHSPKDQEIRAWRPERAGDMLARIDRVEWYLEREILSYFSKFLQGYYDSSIIPSEVFDQVMRGGALTPEMAEQGIRLVRDYTIDVYYIGFNMQDDRVGAPDTFKDPALEANREEALTRNRKLRQAMSLAIDSEEYIRIFWNRLGVPAQSPIPPGLFGYDPDYRNPYRQFDPDLTLAKELMAEAGYPNGVDPATGRPLELDFVVGSTDTRLRAIYNFYIDGWARLGIQVRLDATDYNKFQKKMFDGAYELFTWGWLADYPDPENFLFLLYGPNSSRYGPHRPNSARFENDRYDRLFRAMSNIRNDESGIWEEPDPDTGEMRRVTAERGEIIREMVGLLEQECPWIPLFHQELYYLYHEWLKDVKPFPITDAMTRFHDIDTELRAQRRADWNRPIRWPALAVAAALIAFLVPAILTMRRERR